MLIQETIQDYACIDCLANIEVPSDAIAGEIVSCEDCGLDYVVVEDKLGRFCLQELTIEGEDWGE